MIASTVCEVPGCPQGGEERPLTLVLAPDEVVLCGSCGQARTIVGEPERAPVVAPSSCPITTIDTVPPFPMTTFLGTDIPLPPEVVVWDGLTGGVTESGLIIATELQEG